jgi:RNA recognition motif-containing protein
MYPLNACYGDKLFVGNLPFNATEAEIWSLFSAFGQVIEVVFLGNGKSRSGQACAFVRFADHESAISAINHLDARVPFRPNEDPTLLLQVRPARSNSHPALPPCKSTASGWQPAGESSPYRTSNGIPPTSFEVYQPSLPLGSVRLFVGNIPVDVSAPELNYAFKEKGIMILERDTFMMTGSRLSHNSICAFVVVEGEDESKKAIEMVNNKVLLRPHSQPLKVKIANQMNTTTKGLLSLTKRLRSHSDTVITTIPQPPQPMTDMSNSMHQSVSDHHDGRFFHPTPPSHAAPLHAPGGANAHEYLDWKEPSIKTYHPYMMMPQSLHYGQINIAPGTEPWRNNGIYSLPAGSYTPFMGQ